MLRGLCLSIAINQYAKKLRDLRDPGSVTFLPELNRQSHQRLKYYGTEHGRMAKRSLDIGMNSPKMGTWEAAAPLSLFLEHASNIAELASPLVDSIQREDRDLVSQVRRAVSGIGLTAAEAQRVDAG